MRDITTNLVDFKNNKKKPCRVTTWGEKIGGFGEGGGGEGVG